MPYNQTKPNIMIKKDLFYITIFIFQLLFLFVNALNS